jgi:hypothetical protein
MPELLSHCSSPGATVHQVLDAGLDTLLVARPSTTAAAQLASLLPLLASAALSDHPDKRSLPLCSRPGGGLRTASLYKLCTDDGERDAQFSFVWRNFGPSRVRFFAWLLVKSRIQTRDNLLRKTIVSVAEAGCPMCTASMETASHLILHCPAAEKFWVAVGVAVPTAAHIDELHLIRAPLSVPAETASTFLLLGCWHLWKQRNAKVFRGEDPSLPRLLKNCRDDATLWRGRLPSRLQDAVDAWLACLRNPDVN